MQGDPDRDYEAERLAAKLERERRQAEAVAPIVKIDGPVVDRLAKNSWPGTFVTSWTEKGGEITTRPADFVCTLRYTRKKKGRHMDAPVEYDQWHTIYVLRVAEGYIPCAIDPPDKGRFRRQASNTIPRHLHYVGFDPMTAQQLVDSLASNKVQVANSEPWWVRR